MEISVSWFRQARCFGKFKEHTLYPNREIAEIFSLSKHYVSKLVHLYFFILNLHYSNEKIVYNGKIYHTASEYGLVEEAPVDSVLVTNTKRPVSFGEAWKIYSYYKKKEKAKI